MNLTGMVSGIPKARLIALLVTGCIVLLVLLGLSLWGNYYQFRSSSRLVAKLGAELAASEAKAAAELASCAGVNANVAANLMTVADELQACRGEEQRVTEALQAALRQRDLARQSAAGEAQMRREAIEAIVRTHETECARRPVCRALSDQLLGREADSPAE